MAAGLGGHISSMTDGERIRFQLNVNMVMGAQATLDLL